MQVQTMHFKARAGSKLADERLQQNLTKLSTKFVSARASAVRDIDFEATRAALKERRDRALDNLDVWLETFEREAARRGATVLYAESTQDAARLVADIARKHDVKKVIKTKSMVSEEMQLNRVLGEMGVQSIETDLGEYILQINDNEPPSHIIAPVVHKDKEQIADLFAKTHNKPRLTDIPAFHVGGHGGDGRQLSDRGDGVGGGRHERGQRGHVHGDAARACRGDGHREGAPDTRGSRDRHAPPAALGDRADDLELLFAADRTARAGRVGRPGAHVLRARRWRAHRAHRRRVPGNAALYPLRRVHESLPGLSEDRWACVRLGLSGTDGLRVDAGVRRH
jgi:hypothetical protein